MKRQLGPMLVALALICAPAAWSQTGSSDSSSSGSSSDSSSTTGSPDSSSTGVQNGVQDASPVVLQDPSPMGSQDSPQNSPGDTTQQQTEGPQATFTHPEQLPSLNSLSELSANTGIRLNFLTGTVSDYVRGGQTYGNYWQTLALFGGGATITQVRSKMMWTVGYLGGLSLNQVGGGNNYTTLNQGANGNIIWAFARHWQLRVKDHFLYTDDPFQPYTSFTTDPMPNDPNPIIYFPNAVTEQNLASADITYQLGPHDSVDFSGGESFQRYLRGVSGLWDSFTYSGGAFYQHEFSPRLSAGTGYSFTALDFGHGQSRAGVNMIEGFLSYQISPGMSISAWVGPQFTNTKDEVPIFCTPYGCFVEIQHNSSIDVAEGATFGWAAPHNSFRAQFSHRVTDGGGVLGVVNLDQVTAGYSRPLSRLWGFGAGFLYNKSDSVSHFRSDQYLNSIQGTVNLSRKISDAWHASIYYAFIRQDQNYYGLPGTLSTSGIGLTIRYGWGHSLGR